MNTAVSVRLLTVLLVGAAVAMATLGSEAVPLWIIGLSARGGTDPELTARIVIGVSAALAGVLLVLGPRGRASGLLAKIISLALLFSGIADLSAVLSLGTERATGLVRPALQIIAGLLCLIPALRRKDEAERPRQHPGLAGAGVVVALLVGAGIAANVTVPMPAEGFRPGTASRGADGRFVVNEFTVEDWVGRPIEDTELQKYLPAVRALVEEQPTIISFYRPNCDGCHDLFDAHFGERLPIRVIAIRVPPAEGVEMGESDLPDDVFCADCVKLALPAGPVWLVPSPIVIEVVDGVVTCVSTDDYDRCISDAISRAETAPAAG